MQDPVVSNQAGLSRDSNVLLINTEGATAPAIYRELVGESAESVVARQKAFVDRGAGRHA
jgi:diaminopropionate ammonia-lyase